MTTAADEPAVSQFDPKGLIRESYRIAGIDASQCRSIFLDWALSMPMEVDMQAALSALLDHYGSAQDTHPMTAVLREGLVSDQRPKRRGGWRSRPRS
ncbi:hypothetical protein [Tritonibacter horizontis]|uniref:Uncharacterized protein n=1 Tax=Tritonibacter horizontis TaxID=1768241 RepID=A0A132BVA6_9RHOB|nr:hypothetical protein [Tritonibacter horizontis]KUP92293.1 hypothetical protein TRIHO_29350 [Tritonibacter horizontis]